MDLMRSYIVQVVAIFMNIHALLKCHLIKKLYTVWFQFWLLAVLVVAVVLHLHLCVGVFFGDEAVLVSFSEDKIKILQNRNIISETFLNFL